MTTIDTLIARCGTLLQDSTQEVWSAATIRVQLLEAIAQLARQQLFGLVVWQQGVSGTSRYVFADTTIEFAEVLYNGKGLRPVQDETLTRYQRNWETQTGPPACYTRILEAPNTVRVVPIPTVTGDNTPVFPMVPLANIETNNLIAYCWVNPQEDAETMALLDVLEDIVVYRAVAVLKGNPGEYMDKSQSVCYDQMATMLTQLLLR